MESQNKPPVVFHRASKSQSNLIKKLQRFMSKVEIINEDFTDETQASPLRTSLNSKQKQTHKVITSQASIDSSNSLFDEVTNATLPMKKFSSVVMKNKSQTMRHNKMDDEFDNKKNGDFSDMLSLKSEMSSLKLELDSCFSYSEFSKEDLTIDEDLLLGVNTKTSKNQNKAEKTLDDRAVLLQKFWKGYKIREHYKKALRKYKICEFLLDALQRAILEKGPSEEKLKAYESKMKIYQEKLLETIRKGRKIQGKSSVIKKNVKN